MSVIEGRKADGSAKSIAVADDGSVLVSGFSAGALPEDRYSEFSGSVTNETNITVVEITNATIYDAMVFSVVTLSGTTPAVKVYASFDDINYEMSAPLAVQNVSVGSTISGTAGVTAGGSLSLTLSPIKARRYKLVYTASVAGNCSIRGAMWKR